MGLHLGLPCRKEKMEKEVVVTYKIPVPEGKQSAGKDPQRSYIEINTRFPEVNAVSIDLGFIQFFNTLKSIGDLDMTNHSWSKNI